jgi:protein gp37
MTIEYTDVSWNPVVGCKPFSLGCLHCYAARDAATRLSDTPAYQGLARRLPGKPDRYEFTGEVHYRIDEMTVPLRKTKPTRFFVLSTSDLFYEGIEQQIVDSIFATMLLTPWHTYMLLTKRANRALDYLRNPETYQRILGMANLIRLGRPGLTSVGISDPTKKLPPWIWFGVSVEDRVALERLRVMTLIPATRRWVSFAPLIGDPHFAERTIGIDWAVFEGESGEEARPFDLVDLRRCLAVCRNHRIPAYVKQLGSNPYNGWDPNCHGGPDCDCKRLKLENATGHDPEEWPEDVRVQQMPEWYKCPITRHEVTRRIRKARSK